MIASGIPKTRLLACLTRRQLSLSASRVHRRSSIGRTLALAPSSDVFGLRHFTSGPSDNGSTSEGKEDATNETINEDASKETLHEDAPKEALKEDASKETLEFQAETRQVRIEVVGKLVGNNLA